MKTQSLLCCTSCLVCMLGRFAFAQQAVDPECGAYTLYVGLKALDSDIETFADLEERLGGVPSQGYSLGALAEAAESYGMQTLGVQTTVENLLRRPGRFACIAHIDGNHFVNIASVEEGVVSVIDPPRTYTMPVDTFCTRWDGTALLISREPLLAEEDLPRAWPWNSIAFAPVAILAGYTLWIVLRGRRIAPGQ